MKERAQQALSSLQRNVNAMSMLRARLESRLCSNSGDVRAELERVLELVKNGQVILTEMSGKIEAAKYLEEFMIIMDSAAESVKGIRGDIEKMVPLAESALDEINKAVFKVSGYQYPGVSPTTQELQRLIMEEAAQVANKQKSKNVKLTTTTIVQEKVEEREAEPA